LRPRSDVVGQQAPKPKIIGLIATLSGPPAVLGQQHCATASTLAVKTLGGKLGGREVELIVADDELKPDVAVDKVKALIDRDKVDFVVGPIFSNILQAIMKPVTEAGVFLISPNAGRRRASPARNATRTSSSHPTRTIRSTRCSEKYAQDTGIKKVIIIVPNYQAGKDAAAGFKH
jgi:branched-chain amino acid transport system substrate-binding protein